MADSKSAFDPRITPARPDLAAKHLEGRVNAARFIEGTEFEVFDPIAPVRREPSHDAAIVAANDLLALGALDAVHKLGLRCPADVSVVGHNDMPLVDLISPPLTTVRIGHREMGRGAAKLLLREIETRSVASEHIVLQPELIVRESTQPV